jgi:hypothetical protein
MISYTSHTASSLAGVTQIDSLHRTGDFVYGVESIPVYVASGAAQSVVYSIGTSSSKYYSVISATYASMSVGTSNAQAIIRNH